ncbi:MAG: N-acetylglucosamine-6-phosphate deacetylase [Mariniblastus sp.]|jgi:N-acetylglucosamine-6-phosphate deacetylase
MKPFDIQINGYAGVDFCSNELDATQLHHACEKLIADGVDSILATVITDTIENLCAKLTRLVRLREADSLASKLIMGLHIEGPFLNPTAGYIGAHQPELVRPANVEDAKRLLEASDGLARLVTLAPECDDNCATTKFLVEQAITVSAGHCNPSRDQLLAAIDNGLSMVTHFGNGCPLELPRHDNFLNRALSLRDQLWFCFIPDGAHIEFFALKNYLDLVGLDRTIMVTDAISAATLGPGRHEISGMVVEVDAKGVARKPGFLNLAGSTITLPEIQKNLAERLHFTQREIELVVDTNPRKALRLL